MPDISQLEQALGVTFLNKDTLRQALVHRSYLNEHPDFPLGHNERLEFLGDAVVELVVTEFLYHNYENPEGDLTNWRASLVNADMMAGICETYGVDDFMLLSRGESKDAKSKARRYILANAFEAIIGAIYIDRGWEESKQFILRSVISKLPEILEHRLYIDPKSRFQEAAQEHVGVTPSYRVLSEEGPDHAKKFQVGIYLEKDLIAVGTGMSKQEAQVAAAAEAVKVKGW